MRDGEKKETPRQALLQEEEEEKCGSDLPLMPACLPAAFWQVHYTRKRRIEMCLCIWVLCSADMTGYYRSVQREFLLGI
jgi:hypothetical protein